MSQRVGELLLKAMSGLSQEEQAELLGGLLGGGSRWEPPNPRALGAGVRARHAVLPDAVAFPLDVDLNLWADPILADLRAVQAAAVPSGDSESPLKVLPVRLPASDYERLRAWSRSHDFSMAVIVRTLVERFLDGQGPPGPGRAETDT
jgi:hypothetical protein